MIPTPTSETITALLISYTYVLFLLSSAEVAFRRFCVPLATTRKVIHVGAGTYVLATLWLFDQWEYVMVLLGSFVFANALFLYLRLFKSMDPQTGATLGTIYFAFSCVFLIGWFHDGWEEGFPRGRAYLAMAGIMAMTYGDAFAAIIGERYGRHGYQVIGDGTRRKSIEGSEANFIASFIAISISWWIMNPPELASSWNLIFGAMIASTISSLLEAVSPHGTDNLTVPIGVSFALAWMGF